MDAPEGTTELGIDIIKVERIAHALTGAEGVNAHDVPLDACTIRS
jgi:hypothetical protein